MAAFELARRLAAGAAHDLPEHRMVGVPAAVVAHQGADVVRQRIEVGEDLVQRLCGPVAALRRRGVEVVDVGRMVAVVMDLHRLGVDVRLVLVCRVGQGIEFEGSRRRLGVSRADDARGRDRAKAGENMTTVQHRVPPLG